jgi:hypothetical protein
LDALSQVITRDVNKIAVKSEPILLVKRVASLTQKHTPLRDTKFKKNQTFERK